MFSELFLETQHFFMVLIFLHLFIVYVSTTKGSEFLKKNRDKK